jgi:DNA-binding CsgD family transcriptional regulator
MTADDDRFWQVFGTSRCAMLIADDDGRYTDANEPACDLFGRSRAEIVGRAVGELSAPGLFPDARREWGRLAEVGHLVISWPVEGRQMGLTATRRAAPDRRHLLVLMPAEPGEPTAAREPRGTLSPREREVTRLLAMGNTGEEIARELVLSPETVRTHVRNAMERMGARTRAHLIALALRDGLIEL